MNETMTFDEWLSAFIDCLISSGIPETLARKYQDIYLEDAESYYYNGSSPEEAACDEILN